MSQSPYRRIYPNEEAIVFDGGLDNKFDKALIPNNESPDCANVHFFNGSVETRDGAVKLNTAPAGNVAFDALYTRRDNSNAETMIAFIGGHMLTLGATTFVTVPSAQSVFTIGQRIATEFAENYMFIGNGGVNPYKWDGINFTLHGVPAPVSALTAASNGAGSLTSGASYLYWVTYFNSALVEGNVSPASTTFTVSSTGGQNSLSNIPTAPQSFGVFKRRVYRNSGSNSALRLMVTDILDNTTTTFNDNTPDTNLGVAAPTDNGVPPNYSAICFVRGILFVNDPANPNFVRYSNIGTPYTFASSNFFKVGDKTSDLVKGLFAYNNNLVVVCEKSIWINFMPNPGDPTTWRQLPTASPYGSKSSFCFIPFLNRVLFPAAYQKKFVGFASFSGQALDPTTTILNVTTSGSDLTSDKIEPDMFNVQESLLGNISGIVYKTRAYITLTYGSSSTSNNRCYLFDFSMSNLKKENPFSWVPITGWNATQFCVFGGKLYFASSTNNGFVYQVDGTGVFSDDGVAINSYLWTKEFSGFEEDTNFTKDFRYTNILNDNKGNYFMNLTYRVNSDLGQGTTVTVNLNPGGSQWGSMVWGVNLWGGGNGQTENRVYLANAMGKRIQFQYSNQNVAGQAFKVQRMNLAYNIRGFR